ncbi:O antigen biosynthesis rhamnosyltransferase RfbN, partial [Salmonella enterica]|nr:O antigen biosynthesis rhamnosyltransferase RfbN [Salmonella enterica]EBS3432380.1 O antigen biosynthesis rhamnosyltransferase RfbN [Salmonella enterica subsp. enterica serovar Indiana]EDF0739722.1 O antigen biosynthesis rhamnosyltransferase RfbN [Salmonella enterica subsp. enterica serovar Enteritidis]EIS5018086.1 O antigen biosynthesis rhamnosyltransferase RfbN [Salmonella enterica subsp. enterica serovar Saintpaul]MBJ3862780.1 O antigen biosynthesis rhamnosyltransferase RfbN [Salmonella e
MKITLIIPTYNAGSLWPNVLDAIKQQTIYPDKLIVIDSGSKDETVPLASDLKNISIFNIDSKDFNHGGTRNLAVAKTLDADVIIFLTQDAILADSDAIKNLVYYFSDPLIAAVCGRQLPHKDANPLAVHARNFNYSSKSIVKSKADIE